MTKEEIATVLEKVATLLELKDENPFKVRAYTNAARAIETFGGNVENFEDEAAVAKIPGIGKSIALKIKELAATGSLKYLKISQVSSGILELFIAGLLKRSKLFTTTGSARSSSCRRHVKVALLTCRGSQTTQQALLHRQRPTTQVGFNGEVALEEVLRSDLAAHADARSMSLSYRRRKEIVHDLILVATKNHEESWLSFLTTC
jgi:DNA polymerase (family 10)